MAQKAQQLVKMDWPWISENHGGGIILVSDDQFLNLANHPDEAVEKPAPWVDKPVALREFFCQLAERGGTKVHIAYDYFFGGTTRSLYPDSDEFQQTLKKISDVAAEFGMGLEPSILSPLELGKGYHARTGESGRWMHYAEGLRDPQTGLYSVMMWQNTQWYNNKGPTPVSLVGARAFAFREKSVPGSYFFAVDPADIVELPSPNLQPMPGTSAMPKSGYSWSSGNDDQFQAHRVRMWGEGVLPGRRDDGTYDRVMVVLIYQTVEMDYFSPKAKSFLAEMVAQYHSKGINLAGLYSDEMHIQQDWIYHSHLDNGQFAMRYVSPGLEKTYAARYGSDYGDFAKYLVYFTCHQHNFLPTHGPKLPSQHVFGTEREQIYATLLFRRNYFDLLENGVVNLMISAREKVESLYGHPLDTYYHSTWAEAPTIDLVAPGGVQMELTAGENRRKYDYTSEFIWSNTIQQASSACSNYFAWNEFLSGGNNDVCECGFADRNYYGRVLACSLAALNRSPLASAGFWGMPPVAAERILAVGEAYGVVGHPAIRSVQGYTGRKIEVLFLYPQDLTAVEERFGSWMVQYGYANLITADKLVKYGRVTSDGWLDVKGSRYKVLCTEYEPFTSRPLRDLMVDFVKKGGTLIWSSVPPLLDHDGRQPGAGWMRELFGVDLEVTPDPLGLSLPGRTIEFKGALAKVPPMTILTDFMVDRVFPGRSLGDAAIVATVRPGGASPEKLIGTIKQYPGGGQAVYLGFRVRDDQSASTGKEVRTWFEILHQLGAYPASGIFDSNDNPSVISRSTSYLACAFPNGALALAPHYRTHEESWQGGFFRKEEEDQQALADNPVPGDKIVMNSLKIAGQKITYRGRHAVTWRTDREGRLLAFAGFGCTGINVNGIGVRWSSQPLDIAWHPIEAGEGVDGLQPLYRVWASQEGKVRFPLGLDDQAGLEVWKGAHLPSLYVRRRRQVPEGEFNRAGYGTEQIPYHLENGNLVLELDEQTSEHWLYVMRR